MQVSGVSFIRVEYKYVQDRWEDELEKAKCQLEEATQWFITLQNQAPFLFGITATNKRARIYILTPVDVKSSREAKATLVDEFIFKLPDNESESECDDIESKRNFIYAVLNIVKITMNDLFPLMVIKKPERVELDAVKYTRNSVQEVHHNIKSCMYVGTDRAVKLAPTGKQNGYTILKNKMNEDHIELLDNTLPRVEFASGKTFDDTEREEIHIRPVGYRVV